MSLYFNKHQLISLFCYDSYGYMLQKLHNLIFSLSFYLYVFHSVFSGIGTWHITEKQQETSESE